MGTAVFCFGWLSEAVLYYVTFSLDYCYRSITVQPEDLPIPLFTATVYSKSWVRELVNTYQCQLWTAFSVGKATIGCILKLYMWTLINSTDILSMYFPSQFRPSDLFPAHDKTMNESTLNMFSRQIFTTCFQCYGGSSIHVPPPHSPSPPHPTEGCLEKEARATRST